MFSLNPSIYSLLICSRVEVDDLTGGWRINPLSHLAVHRLPASVDLVLVANIMAPAGHYELMFSIFHEQEGERLALATPNTLTVQPGKNVEFMAKVSITLNTTGLYLIEARLAEYDVAYTPFRVSNVGERPGSAVSSGDA